MKPLSYESFHNFKSYIEKQSLQPNKILMHPATWALLSDHLRALYVAILKRGGTVRRVEPMGNGDYIVEVDVPDHDHLESFYLEANK